MCAPRSLNSSPDSPHGTACPSAACHETAWRLIKGGGEKGFGRQRCDHPPGLPPTTLPRRHMLRRDALPSGFITSLSLLYQDDRQCRPSPPSPVSQPSDCLALLLQETTDEPDETSEPIVCMPARTASPRSLFFPSWEMPAYQVGNQCVRGQAQPPLLASPPCLPPSLPTYSNESGPCHDLGGCKTSGHRTSTLG